MNVPNQQQVIQSNQSDSSGKSITKVRPLILDIEQPGQAAVESLRSELK